MDADSVLVLAGGDGTLFHLLCRLARPWPPLILVPNGRGNALARDIGIGREASVDALRVRAMRPSGKLLECFSLSSAGPAHPASLTRRAGRLRLLGRLSYAAASVFTIPALQDHKIASVISGLHCYAPARVRRIRHARIAPLQPMELMIDGELLGPVSAVELDVLPAALRVRIGRP